MSTRNNKTIRSVLSKARLITVLGALNLAAPGAEAQYTREIDPFPMVDIFGDTLSLPFFGGFNDPKPMLIDFDHDGLYDLMIGDVTGRVSYFRNTGSSATPVFSYVDEIFGDINTGTWFTFCDIDADGDYDLFCDAKDGGVAFWQNVSIGSNIAFSLTDTLFGNFATGFNNTPAFADIDGDRDFDFFFGNLTGYLEFYRNIGDSVNYSFVFENSAYDSVYAFPGGNPKNPNHGFSNIRFDDIDSDGDLDLFWGDIFNQNLYFFENLGTPSLSDLTHVTDNFLPASTAGFNHPTFADLDNDGDADLVVGVANSTDIDNLHFYRNDGTATTPSFSEVSSNMLAVIDLISASVPATGDIDGDGDYDLIVGSFSGRLAFFENVEDKLSPSFVEVDTNFQSIDVGSNSSPELVDWDGDGDLDLLIGNSTGKIQYWRNEGNAFNFSPVLVTDQLAGIKVDQLAIPRAVDLNGDGLLDLTVGEWDFNAKANVLIYQNIGSPGNPSLVLLTKAALPVATRDFTLPFFYDWNHDGKYDLLLSTRSIGISLWLNNAPLGSFPDSTTLVLSADTIPGHTLGERLAVAPVDIDYDGDDDLFIGEENGGLNFLRHDGSCCRGNRGNADGDEFDSLDISDLTFLVDYLFAGGPSPICYLEANFDGDPNESVDISDLTSMVDFFFGGTGSVTPCP